MCTIYRKFPIQNSKFTIQNCNLAGLSLFQLRLDHLRNSGQVLFIHEFAVDQNSGDPLDPDLFGIHQIIPDDLCHIDGISVRAEFFHVQAYLPGNCLNLLFIKILVVFKRLVVKIPEFSLHVGGQGSLGGFQCKFVVFQGKVFDHQFDLVWIFLQQLLKYRIQPGTVRSLVVIENGNGDRGVFRALEGEAGNLDVKDLHHLDDFYHFGGAAA